MLFPFHCPNCNETLEVDASLSDTQVGCPHCGGPVAVPKARVDIGSVVAGFRLERLLGKGGTGQVYLARQLSVDRPVAVKILSPTLAENGQAVERFLREGKLAARLDHQHIVTVHEAGEDSGSYYLAMAFVEGESLDERLKRDGVLPEAEALRIAGAVAGALAYAWDQYQLLHRDIKPSNIMVDQRGRVFLTDLGLAKLLGAGGSMTVTGAIVGTPYYMSPEQAQGRVDVGVASDVYSLGATLYHLVAGVPPFVDETLLGVLHMHVHEQLPSPREHNPHLSEGCCRLIDAMMAKQPEERYGNWPELVADIGRVLAGEEVLGPSLPDGLLIGVADTTMVQPLPACRTPQVPVVRGGVPARVHVDAATVPDAPSWPRRLVLAAAVLALLTLGVLLARQRGGTSREDAGISAAPANVPAPGCPWRVPELGMEFVWVGELDMWVGKYEVTNEEYRRKEAHHISEKQGDHSLDGPRQPVVCVNWNQAVSYAKWLSERERDASRLPAGMRYRLPTEDEFLAYAQCGDGREYPWGNEWPPPGGNFSGQESAYGQKLPDYRDAFAVTCDVDDSWENPWGLLGVGGNVRECCANDTDPEQSFGAWRGAAWTYAERSGFRCTVRSADTGAIRTRLAGFRLVLSR